MFFSVDCEVSPWTEWSECKASCMKTRNRTIENEASCGGECSYKLQEKECCTGDDCIGKLLYSTAKITQHTRFVHF